MLLKKNKFKSKRPHSTNLPETISEIILLLNYLFSLFSFAFFFVLYHHLYLHVRVTVFLAPITHGDYLGPEIILKDIFESQIFWGGHSAYSDFFLKELFRSHWAVWLYTSLHKNKKERSWIPEMTISRCLALRDRQLKKCKTEGLYTWFWLHDLAQHQFYVNLKCLNITVN